MHSVVYILKGLVDLSVQASALRALGVACAAWRSCSQCAPPGCSCNAVLCMLHLPAPTGSNLSLSLLLLP